MTIRIKDQDIWEPRRFHSVGTGSNVWKQTYDGIIVRGEEGERRTRGEPTTLREIVKEYGGEIDFVCDQLFVPRQLLAGIIAVESRGKRRAEREEKHLKDWSIGLTQTLTATAHGLARTAPAALQLSQIANEKPLPQGGNLEMWQQLLRMPHIAIRLGAYYLYRANEEGQLQYDPVFCYAAYNAGSPRESALTPWGLHYYRKVAGDGTVTADAMNSFVKWYGDACATYGAC